MAKCKLDGFEEILNLVLDLAEVLDLVAHVLYCQLLQIFSVLGALAIEDELEANSVDRKGLVEVGAAGEEPWAYDVEVQDQVGKGACHPFFVVHLGLITSLEHPGQELETQIGYRLCLQHEDLDELLKK